MFERVAIIGLGLLGGSLAKAMKADGLAGTIAASGRAQHRLDFALNNGIADTATSDPAEAAAGADLVVISTPVGIIPEILDRIGGSLKTGAIVTDVGSTKQHIVETAERILPAHVHFVGGHPMAGSENAGVEASKADLFQNAICVVTSSARTEVGALIAIQTLWKALQCRVMVMTPQEHDFLVAASSHLPHIVAVALCRAVADMSSSGEKILPLLAGGFRDTTRVASGSPEVWRDICLDNAPHIVEVMDAFINNMNEIKEIVSATNPGLLTELFAETKTFRDELPARGLGALLSDYQLIVDVQDRPGVLGEVATALGENHINIKNIIIQTVREHDGGALLLILEKESDLDRAIKILSEHGFTSKRK